MDTKAERGVAVLLAVDVDHVRVLELGLVAVGGRERQEHPVLLLHLHTVELHVLLDETGHGDWRIRAEELLDCLRDHLGVLGQPAAVDRVGGEVPQRRPDA